MMHQECGYKYQYGIGENWNKKWSESSKICMFKPIWDQVFIIFTLKYRYFLINAKYDCKYAC